MTTSTKRTDGGELKPCPFCGGEPILLKDHQKLGFYVACQSCNACTETRAKPSATEVWNTRTPTNESPAPQAVEPNTERFKKLSNEPPARLPEGYSALLDPRSTRELIAERLAAPQPPVEGLREALIEALAGLKYIEPAIPVLRTMFMTADLALGARKAEEMDASNKEAVKKLEAVLAALASPSLTAPAPDYGGK